MSETATPPDARAAKRRQLLTLLAAIAVGLAVVYGAIALFARGQHHGGGDLKSMATGGMSKMAVLQTPADPPSGPFTGPDGKPLTVADLKGKVVVLNLWATWCAPCRKEMPTLAQLQAAYAGKPVVVVALSTDGDADLAKARAFIEGNKPLSFYHVSTDWAFKLNPPAQGFPTTLIFDKSGHERARVVGEADWGSADAHKVVDALADEKA
jgi:thiol-disulfide isomerase/thioredoxin